MELSIERKAENEIPRAKIEKKVKEAIATVLGKKVQLKGGESFVVALGFNSLRMVSLALALEEEFGTPLLLNDWISRADDPRSLTIESLCDYVESIVRRQG